MSAAVVPPPCDRFYNNLLCMKSPIVDAIVEYHKNGGKASDLVSTDLVDLAFRMASMMDHQELLNLFIERTHSHWPLIARSQDVAAVLQPALSSFGELGADRISEILDVVKSHKVNKDIQEKLLTLGRSLVKISLRYLHSTPSEVPAGVDVRAVAKLYGLEL